MVNQSGFLDRWVLPVRSKILTGGGYLKQDWSGAISENTVMVWSAGHLLQGGQYAIEAVLGRGYSGIVYKALDVPRDRTVAIKTPKSDADGKFSQRLLEEGRLLARLAGDPHPHIVGICDRFQEGETHCLVLDFVPGETLSQRVKRQGALPEAEAVSCIQQIGNALVTVHCWGLTHCDAQPNNIILRAKRRSR